MRRVARLLGDEFFLTYADGLGNVDLVALREFHRGHGGSATLTTVPLPSQYGTLDLDEDGRVCRFREKPRLPDHVINAGFFVLDQRALDHWPDPGEDLEREVLPALGAGEELYAFRHLGFWKSMDTYKDAVELGELCGGGRTALDGIPRPGVLRVARSPGSGSSPRTPRRSSMRAWPHCPVRWTGWTPRSSWSTTHPGTPAWRWRVPTVCGWRSTTPTSGTAVAMNQALAGSDAPVPPRPQPRHRARSRHAPAAGRAVRRPSVGGSPGAPPRRQRRPGPAIGAPVPGSARPLVAAAADDRDPVGAVSAAGSCSTARARTRVGGSTGPSAPCTSSGPPRWRARRRCAGERSFHAAPRTSICAGRWRGAVPPPSSPPTSRCATWATWPAPRPGGTNARSGTGRPPPTSVDRPPPSTHSAARGVAAGCAVAALVSMLRTAVGARSGTRRPDAPRLLAIRRRELAVHLRAALQGPPPPPVSPPAALASSTPARGTISDASVCRP
ncbi:MAG: sugar phosphate nucleotidyltransferase [Acidimicrobiia bacterium]|nr:sugar phosphate nucleotidyltransferase [Acidimicrobiia bacterium]